MQANPRQMVLKFGNAVNVKLSISRRIWDCAVIWVCIWYDFLRFLYWAGVLIIQTSSIWSFLWFMLTSIHVKSAIKVNQPKITSRVSSKISFFNFSRKLSIWGLKYVHTTNINMHLAHILVCVWTLYLDQKLSYSLVSIATWARSKRAWFLEMSQWRKSLPESIWSFTV